MWKPFLPGTPLYDGPMPAVERNQLLYSKAHLQGWDPARYEREARQWMQALREHGGPRPADYARMERACANDPQRPSRPNACNGRMSPERLVALAVLQYATEIWPASTDRWYAAMHAGHGHPPRAATQSPAPGTAPRRPDAEGPALQRRDLSALAADRERAAAHGYGRSVGAWQAHKAHAALAVEQVMGPGHPRQRLLGPPAGAPASEAEQRLRATYAGAEPHHYAQGIRDWIRALHARGGPGEEDVARIMRGWAQPPLSAEHGRAEAVSRYLDLQWPGWQKSAPIPGPLAAGKG